MGIGLPSSGRARGEETFGVAHGGIGHLGIFGVVDHESTPVGVGYPDLPENHLLRALHHHALWLPLVGCTLGMAIGNMVLQSFLNS